jgi:hypothetical protein
VNSPPPAPELAAPLSKLASAVLAAGVRGVDAGVALVAAPVDRSKENSSGSLDGFCARVRRDDVFFGGFAVAVGVLRTRARRVLDDAERAGATLVFDS